MRYFFPTTPNLLPMPRKKDEIKKSCRRLMRPIIVGCSRHGGDMIISLSGGSLAYHRYLGNSKKSEFYSCSSQQGKSIEILSRVPSSLSFQPNYTYQLELLAIFSFMCRISQNFWLPAIVLQLFF